MTESDPQGMMDVVRSSPDLWAQGSAAAATAMWTLDAVRAVVVAGMGGSGISGDAAVLLASATGTAPVVVAKDYHLPAWAGQDTPVVAVSHSGNTEETLAVAEAALARGCPLAAVTSGGALADLVGHGPVVHIPGDHQPRASFPLLVGAVVGLLDAAGVLPGHRDVLATVADALGPRIDDLDTRAEQDASRLGGRVPVFVGGAGPAALVAARAKCQVNENAELPAFSSVLPEANHNEIVGWGSGPDVPYTLVPIRDAAAFEHDRIAARFDITGTLLEQVTDAMPEFRLPDGELLLRLAAGVAYVDLLSVHLALHRQVDPTPVERIGELKRRMAAV